MGALVIGDGSALARAAVDTAIGLVGWPHNTLTSIRENGSELADWIQKSFSPNGPKLVFVCHSRGGLVARAAAATLFEAHDAWGKALTGLITFGTPHLGAGIAEHALKDLATYFLLLQSTKKVVSLVDVLVYLDARTAEGIEQLKPAQATTESRPGTFVSELFDRERKWRDKITGRRRPPIMAVGGKLDEAALTSWRKRAASAFLGRWLGKAEHDLVVELASSTAGRLDAEVAAVVGCDHFGYFEGMATAASVLDFVLGRIWAQLDLAKVFEHLDIERAGGTIAGVGKWVWINGIRVPAKPIRLKNQKS